MTTLFEDRERAAEYGFTHAEELRFLSVREGLSTTARWAAETLEESEEAGANYADRLVGRLVAGVGETDLVALMRKDLENGGRPDRGGEVGTRFAQAVATASDRLHGRSSRLHEPGTRAPRRRASHPHEFWGWTV